MSEEAFDFYEYISRPKGAPLVEEEFADIIEPMKSPDAIMGDVVDAQIKLYGFKGTTYDVEHEIAHSIIGDTFLDMGESPIRLQSPHNGNIFSEPLAEGIQAPISIFINSGERIPPISAEGLRERVKGFAVGRLAADYNALISSEDYANRMGDGRTAMDVFRDHDYDSGKVFRNPDILNFQQPPPPWSQIFSDSDLERISEIAARKVNAILDYLETKEQDLPKNATANDRRLFFNQILRDMPAHKALKGQVPDLSAKATLEASGAQTHPNTTRPAIPL